MVHEICGGKHGDKFAGAALTLLLGLSKLSALAENTSVGVTDSEIKIGRNAPFSGPASVYWQTPRPRL